MRSMMRGWVAWVVVAAGCASAPVTTTSEVVETPRIKNVILIIGDGMGPQQMGLLQEYATRAPGSPYKGRPTAMQRFIDGGTLGMSHHGPAEGLVVDSACSATQLATGRPALSEVIGIGVDGEAAETIVEQAHKQGKATGLVSDTRITHATPAAFVAHVPHRSLENEIAEQLVASDVDVLLSGGLRHFLPRSIKTDAGRREAVAARAGYSVTSKRTDERDLVAEAVGAGYQVVFNREGLASVEGGRVLGLFASSGMADGTVFTRTRDSATRTEPTLREMTGRALELLSKDEDGFFLMVEAGQIDWAGHSNDAGTMLQEMLKTDDMLDLVYTWAEGRDDTLVIITADHETGGFGLSYSRWQVPAAQERAGSAFAGRPYRPDWNFGSVDVLDGLAAQDMSLEGMWATFVGLPEGERTAARLAELVNAHSAFDITEEQAKAVMASESNAAYRVAGHSYLDAEEFPRVEDFEAFYVFGEEGRADLIGRAMATEQFVVWATGTHTHTPVAVVAYGPAATTGRFSRLLHHVEVGRLAQEVLATGR